MIISVFFVNLNYTEMCLVLKSVWFRGWIPTSWRLGWWFKPHFVRFHHCQCHTKWRRRPLKARSVNLLNLINKTTHFIYGERALRLFLSNDVYTFLACTSTHVGWAPSNSFQMSYKQKDILYKMCGGGRRELGGKCPFMKRNSPSLACHQANYIYRGGSQKKCVKFRATT